MTESQTLETVLATAPLQTEGVFELPEEFTSNSTARAWLARMGPIFRENPPVIIRDENYAKSNVAKIIGLHKKIFALAANSYLIRSNDESPLVGEEPSQGRKFNDLNRKPISTLSFAQLVSGASQQPIEEILLSSQEVRARAYTSSPRETVNELFEAYDGVMWFEYFKGFQRTIGELRKREDRVPRISEWHSLSTKELIHLLGYSIKARPNAVWVAISKLYSSGMLVPRREDILDQRETNSKVVVDPSAFAQLISLSQRFDFKDIFIPKDRDLYLDELASSLLNKRVFPYMKERKLRAEVPYTVQKAHELTKASESVIYRARDVIGEAGNSTRVSGIDLALHVLMGGSRKSFTEPQVMDLFGLNELDQDKIGIHFSSERETVSGQATVFPTYRVVARRARQILLGEQDSKIDIREILENPDIKMDVYTASGTLQRFFDRSNIAELRDLMEHYDSSVRRMEADQLDSDSKYWREKMLFLCAKAWFAVLREPYKSPLGQTVAGLYEERASLCEEILYCSRPSMAKMDTTSNEGPKVKRELPMLLQGMINMAEKDEVDIEE